MKKKEKEIPSFMNFIESLFDSFSHGICVLLKECPMDIENYCIGSGSNFVIHKNIDSDRALEIYNKLKSNLELGSEVYSKHSLRFTLQCFHSMESSSGYVYTFMFPIKKIIEYDPNDVIKKWEKFYAKSKASK